VKRILSLLLLLGAIAGLFGQAAAYAAGPHAPMTSTAVSQMSEDCMEMMQERQPEPDKKPCNGLTLDCIAAMGCTLPFVLREVLPQMAVAAPAAARAFWPLVTVLVGSDRPPEIHPPTLLG